MHDMREGVLLEKLPDDPHLHLPQIQARGDRANPVFSVTTRTDLARRAAVFIL